ncbi:enoyl-CoA hydratase/isomerase family protein [Nocardioides sp.]|uniref:enoyl-CoA hydratase/isomerase family protein n=1 Tax=Nocardioides sp. TaxID=35761 RepID=UPI002733B840|nr:enoyl-CoA hydratase/isomerase family protein [Nocardioides sp.]MDP3892739.1 enoyl-CoA hydratase/isomerase family protein [Nocardioides sp.]
MKRLTIPELVAASRVDNELDTAGVPHDPLLVVDLDGQDWSDVHALRSAVALLRQARTLVTVGFATQPLPAMANPLLDVLSCTLAPEAVGCAWIAGGHVELAQISATIKGAPTAAVTLVGVLDLTTSRRVPDGLVAESLAYSMLLAGPEFRSWRARTAAGPVSPDPDPVLVDRKGDELIVTLNRPHRHNAFSRSIRDGLLEALFVAQTDESVRRILLRGSGPSFCSGGDLDEFGLATSTPGSHVIRLQLSAASAIHRLADKMRVEVHGACIGAGIELPSFAGRIEAQAGSWFMLPELRMGLIPGAGGTVGITKRIGRWRTAYMALAGVPVDLDTALEWGLVDVRS